MSGLRKAWACCRCSRQVGGAHRGRGESLGPASGCAGSPSPACPKHCTPPSAGLWLPPPAAPGAAAHPRLPTRLCCCRTQDATPLLYSLVFGEGVVNDATSIVLLRAIQRMHSAAQFSAGALGDVLSNFALLFLFRSGCSGVVFLVSSPPCGSHGTSGQRPVSPSCRFAPAVAVRCTKPRRQALTCLPLLCSYCSLLLGVGVGLLSSLIIKHAFVKHSTDRWAVVCTTKWAPPPTPTPGGGWPGRCAMLLGARSTCTSAGRQRCCCLQLARAAAAARRLPHPMPLPPIWRGAGRRVWWRSWASWLSCWLRTCSSAASLQ